MLFVDEVWKRYINKYYLIISKNINSQFELAIYFKIRAE
jgi:hypothetical protein